MAPIDHLIDNDLYGLHGLILDLAARRPPSDNGLLAYVRLIAALQHGPSGCLPDFLRFPATPRKRGGSEE